MTENSAILTEKQAELLVALQTERNRIERDFNVAMAMALAVVGVSMVEGMVARFEASPPRIFYTKQVSIEL